MISSPIFDHLLAENVWNAEVIFADIKERGYTGGITILPDYINPSASCGPAKPQPAKKLIQGTSSSMTGGELTVEVGGELRKG